MQKTYGIVPGVSWGSLPEQMHGEWSAGDCDRAVQNLQPQQLPDMFGGMHNQFNPWATVAGAGDHFGGFGSNRMSGLWNNPNKQQHPVLAAVPSDPSLDSQDAGSLSSQLRSGFNSVMHSDAESTETRYGEQNQVNNMPLAHSDDDAAKPRKVVRVSNDQIGLQTHQQSEQMGPELGL